MGTPGLLQPLPIPNRTWINISMDFIEGFSKSNGKSIILVVVDRLSKYAHFGSLVHPYKIAIVAKLFMDIIFKLHGILEMIINDYDPTFTSHFWQELFKLQGTHLNMSSAYHPQTDGQIEIINKYLETYLCYFALAKLVHWV